MTHPHPDLTRPIGFYCFESLEDHCVASVLMRNDRVFLRTRRGELDLSGSYGYHLDNHRFAAFLSRYALEQSVTLIDDLVVDVRADERGIAALRLAGGDEVSADQYVDCSGFRARLLDGVFAEPFVPYTDSLFCDRALIGGWERGDEPLRPYTTSEQMDAGWCWQIEHETQPRIHLLVGLPLR